VGRRRAALQKGTIWENSSRRGAAGEFAFELQDGAVKPGEEGLLGGVAVALIFQRGDGLAVLSE
jgi:hypothetical protein